MLTYDIQQLTKIYKNHPAVVNDQITLQIQHGEIFGILGDNGAGKSTLVKQMANLMKPTSGAIALYGEPLHHHPLHVPSYIGYMPQSWLAINQLTVGEALFHTAYLRGLDRRAARQERDRLIELWQLDRLRNKTGRDLSGGERRLLQIGIAMAASPPILILDEPTNELSPQRRKQVWDTLRDLNQTEETTIIFITHDAIEAEKIIQRVGILVQGKLVALGAPSHLKQRLDQSLRLDIVLPAEDLFATSNPFPATIPITKLDQSRWVLRLNRDQVEDVLSTLTAYGIDDFRLSSATLEDLYLHYTVTHQAPDHHSIDSQVIDE